MSAPQPIEQTQPTGHLPPIISVPTTPLGAVQTMASLLPSPAYSQGAPSAYPAAVSPHEMPPGTYVPGSAPPAHAPAPAPATQIAANVVVPAPAASVSSHSGRTHSPPHGTARVTHSSSALPELPYIQPAPIPVFGGPGGESLRRTTAHHADSETFGSGHNRDDPEKDKSKLTVGERLKLTIYEANKACADADRRVLRLTWFLHIATVLQVLIGALTTALGAALSGKNSSVAVATLGGASTFVAAYLARSRSTNEPEASRTRVADLKHFLRVVEAFQLDHKSEMGYDHEIKSFRTGLEQLLGYHQPSAIHQGQAGANTGADATDPKAGLTGAGLFTSSLSQDERKYLV